MKAVVFHDVADVRLDDVPEPRIEEPNDAIVRITSSAICGTDLHMVRGTMKGMEPGTILGHEGVGVVEEVGKQVRNLKVGDRVVIPSTIACGFCSYCRAGYFSQCDNANPNGKRAGTAFFGGPKSTGPFHGLQAEYARIPYANVGPVKLPDSVSDDQALLISDIFPTGYFGADLAETTAGDTVAVFGCGPVGLFTIVSLKLMDAGRILAVDQNPSRLEMARALGAEVIDFGSEDPIDAILQLTGGVGVDRAIDAVGIDAEPPRNGAEPAGGGREPHEWKAGGAPSQALNWCVSALAKAGTLAVIGVYPSGFDSFPFGDSMMKNLTLNMGNCNHRKYMPSLVDMVAAGVVDPTKILTQVEPLTSAIAAYQRFDERQNGWIKVELKP